MPHTKLWVHCVWATRNRAPVMGAEVRRLLIGYIRDYSRQNNIFIDRIDGSCEHLHLLLSLGADQSVSKVVQRLKGASAHWLNLNGLLPSRFSWQEDYFAVSVSESQLERVRSYIDGQEEHHRMKSFAEEYLEFIERFGFTRNEDGGIMENT